MERNAKIDFLRGIAALVVVLGHVFPLFSSYENSILFNIIFTIQMPLFMLISGYCVVFSREVESIKDLLIVFKKRTISLLLPWLVWSVFAYVFFSSLPILDYISKTAFQMENAFWYLFSLWVISIFFHLSRFIAKKITSRKTLSTLITILISSCFIVGLLLIGTKVGLTFLGIKYTCYYFVFYIAGWLFALAYESKNQLFSKTTKVLYPFMLVAFFVLISKYNSYLMEDTIPNIAIRLVSSFCGSFVLLLAVLNCDTNFDSIIGRATKYIGKCSLELYVVQFFTLRIVDTFEFSVLSIEGFMLCLSYFCFVTLISLLLIKILSINKLLRFCLFGK